MKSVQIKNRVIAILLSFAMVLGIMPVNVVWADETVSKYIFNHDGETAKEVIDELKDCFNLVTNYGKTGALQFKAKDGSVDVKDLGISSGIAVFEIEFCPAGKTVQTALFKNSKDETLFAISYVYPQKGTTGLYLASAASKTEVKLQDAKSNMWSRVKVEIDLETSKKLGVLQYRISSAYYNTKSSYSEDYSTWTKNSDVTQDKVVALGNDNGTFTSAIDGTTDHPFDLGKITLSSSTNTRWLGDISLYNVTSIDWATAPTTQYVGTSTIVPNGNEELKLTYSTGATETVKLSDLSADDYTVDFDNSKVAASVPLTLTYKGLKTPAVNVEVKEADVTAMEIVDKANAQKIYYVGKPFQDDLMLKLTCKAVDVTFNTTVSLAEKIKEGTASVDFTSAEPTGEEGKTVTVTYGSFKDTIENVVVKTPTVKEFKVIPNKTHYTIGEKLDLTVKLVYDSGDEEILEEGTGYTVSEFDNTKPGIVLPTIYSLKGDNNVTLSLVIMISGDKASFEYVDGTTTDITGFTIDSTTQKTNSSNKLKVETAVSDKTCNIKKEIGTLESGKVVINTEMYVAKGKAAFYKILDKDGNALINFGNWSKFNLYEGEVSGGSPSLDVSNETETRGKYWLRVKTVIDLDKSNVDGILNFKANIYYYNGAWIFLKTVTQDDYIGSTFENANGCATDSLKSFSIGSLAFGGDSTDTYFDNIEVYTIPLKSFAINTFPKQTYMVNEKTLDLTGIVIDEEYEYIDNEQISDVDLIKQKYDISGFDTSTVGTKTIVIKSKADNTKQTSYDINVTEATLTDISVTTKPDKVDYFVGETFDKTGIVVKGTYSDKTTRPLSESEYEIGTVDLSSKGTKTITVTAVAKNEKGEDVTTTFDVEAISIESIEVTTLPTKSEYYVGETLNTNGMVVKATPSKGEVFEMAVSDYEVETVELSEAGTKPVKVKAIAKVESGKTVETTFNITVKEPELVSIKATASKTTYKIGDTFDKSKVEVKATYSNETTKTIAADDFEVSGFDSTKVAESQEITVTYKGKTDKFTIKIIEASAIKNQSFYYIDQETTDETVFTGNADGVFAIATGEKGGNTTPKISVKNGIVSKTFDSPITSGTVTFETVTYHNSAIFATRIVDSEGKGLINYSQQTSGNLNLYEGVATTGSVKYMNLASKDKVKNKWVKTVTEIDLDASNTKGILQFTLDVYYKSAYTDEEWTKLGTFTQNDTYVSSSFGFANGAADSTITTFDIGGIAFESAGTSYADDVLFNDGNGIEGIVTVTSKELTKVEVTSEPTIKEFQQGAKLNTTGLVLTGTYLWTYSDGSTTEKTKEVTIFKTDYDFSKVANDVPVTITVEAGTDGLKKAFTYIYKVNVIEKADSSFITFEYTDDDNVGIVGFDGSKVSVTRTDISGNESNKITVAKGTTTKTLDETATTGIVHFETDFLTTATSKASLFLRILNSEGLPMVDIGQYGSSNLNLYLDKATSGTTAGQFKGLTVNKWAKVAMDIDLNASATAGHLVFDAEVWTTDDYEAGNWKEFAKFDETLYLNSTTAASATGAASTKATVFDVAAVEIQNAGSATIYFDDMYFEAVQDGATKTFTNLELTSAPSKKEYFVGDTLNTNGLVLTGTYVIKTANGKEYTRTARVLQYDVDFNSQQEAEETTVTISVGGKSVAFTVVVKANAALDGIEQYLVDYVNNKLVKLQDDNSIYLNKRNILLPSDRGDFVTLTWSIDSDIASINERVLTVVPSIKEELTADLVVEMYTKNESGDKVLVKKTIKLVIPQASSKDTPTTDLLTDEALKEAIEYMVERGLFDNQGSLLNSEDILGQLDRNVLVEEMVSVIVKLFDIDTTYTDTEISRDDINYFSWYKDAVVAAFQLSVETQASRENKDNYGIGDEITKADIEYMLSRIVAIDQTTLPSDYFSQMFE